MFARPPAYLWACYTEDISAVSLNNSVNVTANEQSLAMKLTKTTLQDSDLNCHANVYSDSMLENIPNIEGRIRDFLINQGTLRISDHAKLVVKHKTLSSIRKSQETIHTFSNLFIVIIKLFRP